MLGWLLVLLSVLVTLFFLLSSDNEVVQNLGAGQLTHIAAFATLAILLIVSLASDYRGRGWTALRHALAWIAILAILVGGYTYREELSTAATRIAGELLPPGEAVVVDSGNSGERAVRLRRHPSGHFVARATVNATALTLLVDTGASTVVLKPADAERAGIDTSSLSFTVPVSTANGTTYAAPVRLKLVAVGPLEQRDVEALVAKPGALTENLLGMSFLKRLRSYEFTGDFLTLRG